MVFKNINALIRIPFRFLIVVWLYFCVKITLFLYKPRIIFIIGNVGKTTTKNAVFAVLNKKIKAKKTQKSINGFSGVLLSILGLTPPQNMLGWAKILIHAGIKIFQYGHMQNNTLVLEVGIDKPGDMKRIVRYVTRPDIVVATAFPPVPVHLENFPNINALYYEKGYAFEYLKEHGVIVSNGDDILLQTHIRNRADPHRHLYYGMGNSKYTVCGLPPEVTYNDEDIVSGTRFEIICDGERGIVLLPNTIGDAAVYASLAALTIGFHFKIPLKECLRALRVPDIMEQGRATLKKGIKGTIIIDDTYNASPLATQRILSVFSAIQHNGRKIIVLGDLLELGEEKNAIFSKIVKQAEEITQEIYLIGDIKNHGSDTAKGFKTVDDAIPIIFDNIQKKDLVLCKGSHSMQIEKVVKKYVDA